MKPRRCRDVVACGRRRRSVRRRGSMGRTRRMRGLRAKCRGHHSRIRWKARACGGGGMVQPAALRGGSAAWPPFRRRQGPTRATCPRPSSYPHPSTSTSSSSCSALPQIPLGGRRKGQPPLLLPPLHFPFSMDIIKHQRANTGERRHGHRAGQKGADRGGRSQHQIHIQATTEAATCMNGPTTTTTAPRWPAVQQT